MEERKYNCKILLYGEYTVLFGSPALAIPSGIFSGRWTTSGTRDRRLEDFARFLGSEDYLNGRLAVDQMRSDIREGLIFESTIPIGYGMGSSGALTAAVYDRYATDASSDVVELQKVLSRMEAFFHGQSSGIDPLVSYLDLPILRTAQGLRTLDQPDERALNGIFLLDSGRSRSTSQLVSIFRKRLEDPAVEQVVQDDWTPLVTEAIDAHLEGRSDQLQKVIKKIQRIIWDVFPEFIPKSHLKIWEETLKDPNTALKLCGAGGGGMTLGFGTAPHQTNSIQLSS